MNSSSDGLGAAIAGILGFFALILVVWFVVWGFSMIGARATPQAGEIGVVRTGPSCVWIGSCFNGHKIRTVIKPGSGSSFIGLGSDVHYYPSDTVQRNYTITADSSRGDRPGVDVVEVSTSDGIRIGLEGTFYFTTAFNGSSAGEVLVKDFDNRFGIRTFPVTGSTGELHPYNGVDGWEAFLDTVIRPIIDNDVRQSVGQVSCAQLVASCALVYNQNVNAVTTHSGQNQATLTQIQTTINNNLQSDIKHVLGQDYFSNIQFLISGKPRLPDTVQQEIDNAQAQFAKVGTTRAQLQQASYQARANEARQKGYVACKACAAIDELKAIPSNVTTFAPGAGFAITP